jgi:hypothetical protein
MVAFRVNFPPRKGTIDCRYFSWSKVKTGIQNLAHRVLLADEFQVSLFVYRPDRAPTSQDPSLFRELRHDKIQCLEIPFSHKEGTNTGV